MFIANAEQIYPSISYGGQDKHASELERPLDFVNANTDALLQKYLGFSYYLSMGDDVKDCDQRFRAGVLKWCVTSRTEMEKCRIMQRAFKVTIKWQQ